MPKRSEQHLSMRREQVLSAALRCFARQGFHATSMADVIAESGMSAGSVYRYFPSKTALVHAGSQKIMDVAHGALTELLERDAPASPSEALRLLLTRVLEIAVREDVDLTPVGVSAWGEALRDAELHAQVSSLYGSLREDFQRILERWRDTGHLPADADMRTAAQVLFSTMPGFLLQRLLLHDVEVESYVDGLELLIGAPAHS